MGATLSKAVIGWAALAAAGYFFYNWYSRDNRRAVKSKQKGRSTFSSLARAAGSSDSQSGTDRPSTTQDSLDQKRKKKKSQKVKDTAASQKPSAGVAREKASPVAIATAQDQSDDDKNDNLEFARQLQSAKLGTSMAQSTKKSVPPASKKQTHGNGPSATSNTNGVQHHSAPASSIVAEAEDGDAQFGTTVDQTHNSGSLKGGASGISDMLEAPSPGPAVLRITEPEFQTATRKKNAPMPAQQAETKKQRQNRQKNEERKAAREEEEQARRVLMEKQRRTAREAEGRAAKDGSTFVPATSIPTSVWVATQIQSNGREAPTSARNNDLLDTFDPSRTSTSGRAGTSPAPVPQSSSWETSLPSEEEQMRQLQGDDAWATVTNKKTRKPGSGKPPLSSGADAIESNGSRPVDVKHTISKPAAAYDMSSFAPITDTVDFTGEELSHQPDQKVGAKQQYTPGDTTWTATQLFQDDEWEVA